MMFVSVFFFVEWKWLLLSFQTLSDILFYFSLSLLLLGQLYHDYLSLQFPLPSNPHMCTVDPSPHQELFCQRRRNVEFQRVGSRMLAATAQDDPDLPDIQPVEEGSGCGVGDGIRGVVNGLEAGIDCGV